MIPMNKTGKCVILSAPSGAGKTTIVRYLLEQNIGLSFSVSACSRAIRGSEIDGQDYYFLSLSEFKKRIEQNDFVEWEEVYADHFYGTLKSQVQRIWNEDRAVVFDVDVVGGLNLKHIFGNDALALFVQPPTIEILEERLRGRSTETEEKILQRMQKARKELTFAAEFDTILINDNLHETCQKAKQLVSEFLSK
jgi:guanylate kinase